MCSILSHIQFNDSILLYSSPPESEIKKTTLPFHNYSDINENLNIKEERVLGYTSKNIYLWKMKEVNCIPGRNVFYHIQDTWEVMVTADSKMVHHHGQNLQHYVLTLMSIVSKLNRPFVFSKMFYIIFFFTFN